MPSRHHCDKKKEKKQKVDAIVGVYNFNQTTAFPPGVPIPNLTVQGVMQFHADGSVIQMPTALLGLTLLPGQPAISGSHTLGRWTKTSHNKYSVTGTLVCVKTAQPSNLDPDNFSRSKLSYDLTLVRGSPYTFTATGGQSEYKLADIGLTTPGIVFPPNVTTLSFTFEGVKVI